MGLLQSLCWASLGVTLFPREPTQRLGVPPNLAGQTATTHPEVSQNVNSFTILAHRWESCEVL